MSRRTLPARSWCRPAIRRRTQEPIRLSTASNRRRSVPLGSTTAGRSGRPRSGRGVVDRRARSSVRPPHRARGQQVEVSRRRAIPVAPCAPSLRAVASGPARRTGISPRGAAWEDWRPADRGEGAHDEHDGDDRDGCGDNAGGDPAVPQPPRSESLEPENERRWEPTSPHLVASPEVGAGSPPWTSITFIVRSEPTGERPAAVSGRCASRFRASRRGSPRCRRRAVLHVMKRHDLSLASGEALIAAQTPTCPRRGPASRAARSLIRASASPQLPAAGTPRRTGSRPPGAPMHPDGRTAGSGPSHGAPR